MQSIQKFFLKHVGNSVDIFFFRYQKERYVSANEAVKLLSQKQLSDWFSSAQQLLLQLFWMSHIIKLEHFTDHYCTTFHAPGEGTVCNRMIYKDIQGRGMNFLSFHAAHATVFYLMVPLVLDLVN